jgi:hypothetical protein
MIIGESARFCIEEYKISPKMMILPDWLGVSIYTVPPGAHGTLGRDSSPLQASLDKSGLFFRLIANPHYSTSHNDEV